MKYAIIIPDSQALLSDPFEEIKKWDGAGHKSNVISLAYLGRCTQTIMDEKQLVEWLANFNKQTSPYNRIYIERLEH